MVVRRIHLDHGFGCAAVVTCGNSACGLWRAGGTGSARTDGFELHSVSHHPATHLQPSTVLRASSSSFSPEQEPCLCASRPVLHAGQRVHNTCIQVGPPPSRHPTHLFDRVELAGRPQCAPQRARPADEHVCHKSNPKPQASTARDRTALYQVPATPQNRVSQDGVRSRSLPPRATRTPRAPPRGPGECVGPARPWQRCTAGMPAASACGAPA